MRETHISWVFLTRDRAYKVKKPRVLPFLDYGTAEQRRVMCRAEVSLNRRLAPDVYLRVRSLVPAGGGGLRLGEEDDADAVDYAVEMRRYSEADTLAARLAAGAAGSAELAAVGERLAAFHQAAEPDVRPDGAEAVKRALDDNFATLRTLVPASEERAAVGRAEWSAGAFLTAAWDELNARSAAGRVRECHGDLRLEHVVLGREVEIVDCVEFDPGLRRIDVTADLAFLVMELREAGRADLADVLVRSYRAAGGDAGSDALIAFFAAYRAQVRAKVGLLRGDRQEADRLLALADRLAWRARGPLVIAVGGAAATGKTTLAAGLAAASGLPHVSSDMTRKRMLGVEPTARAPLAAYSREAGLRTYRELGRLAASAGSVVVDATFRRRSERDAFRDGLGAGPPAVFVECRAPRDVVRRRAAERLADPDRVSDATPDIALRQHDAFEPFDEVPATGHVTVRSDLPVDALVEEVGDALDRRLPRRHAPTETPRSVPVA